MKKIIFSLVIVSIALFNFSSNFEVEPKTQDFIVICNGNSDAGLYNII